MTLGVLSVSAFKKVTFINSFAEVWVGSQGLLPTRRKERKKESRFMVETPVDAALAKWSG